MTSAMTAIPSANKKANVNATIIFGAAEGFLPSALIAAYPTTAMIMEGPRVLMNITMAIVRFRIDLLSLLFCQHLPADRQELFNQDDQLIVFHPR